LSELREFTLNRFGIYESIQYRAGFAAFFLLNVFLGVIGTFWLRVKKRKEEIGLRIAVGSSRNMLMRQMLAESLLLMAIAVIPAALVWINIVAVGLMPEDLIDFSARRFAINTLLSIGLMSIAVVLATWYPARRAAAMQPAAALHYE
jgi:putative ABC transport system permease protein